MFRPYSDTFRSIFGLSGHNQNESLHKTVMCCHIVARKSVAASSGNFRRRTPPQYVCGQDQEFLRKKSFSKIIIIPHLRTRSDFCKCVTSIAICFFALRAWRGGPQLKIWLWFFFFSIFSFVYYLNIMVTCDQLEKVAYSPKVLLEIFSTNTKLILKVCWIKPFISGLE